MIGRRIVIAVAIALSAGFAAPRAADAALRALVIGIDDYATLRDLDGAVNDARDLADALKTVGADPLVMLLNGEAKRDAILSSWRRLAAEAAPSDVLVVTYAGHGGQEPAANRDASEADEQDETLLLGGFAEEGPGTYERILDDEIAALVAERDDVTVLLVVDACHSGGVTRAVDPRVVPGKLRYSAYRISKDDLLPPPPPMPNGALAEQAPNLAFFGAVRENELVPEVMIEGKPRGALSWSVARGLRGDADFDRDGAYSREELERFVRNAVRAQMDGRQHPRFESAMAGERTLIGAAGLVAAGAPAVSSALPSIGISLLGMDGDEAARMAAGLTGATLVERGKADLIADLGKGVAVTRLGDVVASDLGAGQDLQAVIDRTRFLAWSKSLGLTAPLQIELYPGDRRFVAGERLSIKVAPYRRQALTVFNLAPGGVIQFLYPAEPDDARKVEAARGVSFDVVASAPFGSNGVVALATDEPPVALHEALRRLDGSIDIAGLHAVMSEALNAQGFELGSTQVFTGAADE